MPRMSQTRKHASNSDGERIKLIQVKQLIARFIIVNDDFAQIPAMLNCQYASFSNLISVIFNLTDVLAVGVINGCVDPYAARSPSTNRAGRPHIERGVNLPPVCASVSMVSAKALSPSNTVSLFFAPGKGEHAFSGVGSLAG